MIDIDAATRILIPKDLLVIASLNKSLVLSSAINMIEIWDKELYEQAIDDAALDFAELAEEVMGNHDEDVS
jgi:MraZ protein